MLSLGRGPEEDPDLNSSLGFGEPPGWLLGTEEEIFETHVSGILDRFNLRINFSTCVP